MLGTLADHTAVQLGAAAIAAAVARAGIDPAIVGQVVLGQVLQAGAGQAPARQAAVAAGLPMAVPAITINKVCLSGLTAIAHADQLIRAGEFDVVVAGGMESMTNAPHLLPEVRRGHKFGGLHISDALLHDGLTDTFDHLAMGASTEKHNARFGVGRAEQDEYAAASHSRAASAVAAGVFDAEIIPVEAVSRSGMGAAGTVTVDEGVRPETSVESLARLPAAFATDGTITAGSSSQISDGAAAVIVAERATARRLGLPVLAAIIGYASVAGPDNSLHAQPANAIEAAVSKAGVGLAELDVIEINEAFAAVVVASARQLRLSPSDPRLNPHGGAIALGHPVGASGARLVLHVALHIANGSARLGVAALCGGGGQGDALILRSV
ncbi:MAG: acetyl-CoA C-acyltransferase [Acidimicrobiales bacterium]|nr:MAG: acetyl-CoA C-acyltransferase [Acidimicrobiales bacterium]